MARGKNPAARLVALRRSQPKRRGGGAAGCIVRIARDFDADIEDFEDYEG